MRLFCLIAACFSLACLGTPVFAQGSEAPPAAPGGDFSGLFSFGKPSTSVLPCSYVLKYSLAAGTPCTFDNGHDRGSGMNSSILSMDVQGGGGMKLDLSEITKSWGGAFAHGFNFFFYPMLVPMLAGFGLMIAFCFVGYWIAKWPSIKGGR